MYLCRHLCRRHRWYWRYLLCCQIFDIAFLPSYQLAHTITQAATTCLWSFLLSEHFVIRSVDTRYTIPVLLTFFNHAVNPFHKSRRYFGIIRFTHKF
ncbi:hypothetical protein M128_3343 [Bacteroides fragilis str. S6L8]|nr:hypothetical protein M126_3485 [Bacteroides fragilis str. S6L3]EYA08334.1 hypothetical protein M130_3282 [Bacteroides fragilis str. S6R6]EYA99288.1 hypothetical protein M128_3343 [Bacteroides fragilis str. S6L8]EYB03916.1 hypothetical protein M129_3330 [Bacteroides fragilis str. S6R5]EYE45551.1 hypothetical protein M127_3230 [Bacteroides fragilis str. S6L5]EYE51337.1 hypothetical protein M131_3222 [Bacteroides fragilis str. S6R8]